MEAPSLDRRLVAILAADIEGYSRLMAQDEEAALATLSSHRAVVDELIVAFRGRVANTAGDSVLAEFASVVDTVRCAVRMQQEIADRNAELPEQQRMSFRIGINVGDIIAKDGDIFGDGVNIAAPGQTHKIRAISAQSVMSGEKWEDYPDLCIKGCRIDLSISLWSRWMPIA